MKKKYYYKRCPFCDERLPFEERGIIRKNFDKHLLKCKRELMEHINKITKRKREK